MIIDIINTKPKRKFYTIATDNKIMCRTYATAETNVTTWEGGHATFAPRTELMPMIEQSSGGARYP